MGFMKLKPETYSDPKTGKSFVQVELQDREQARKVRVKLEELDKSVFFHADYKVEIMRSIIEQGTIAEDIQAKFDAAMKALEESV